MQLFYGLNPWESSGGESLKHWVVQPEYRYWFCEAFNGWFLGVHLMGGEFNVGEVDLPFGLFDDLSIPSLRRLVCGRRCDGRLPVALVQALEPGGFARCGV